MPDQSQVFISYSRRDSLFAENLVEYLQSKGYRIWIATNIQPGVDWARQIQQALESSEVMILLISPDSLISNFVAFEYEWFLDNGKPILPILIQNIDQGELPPPLMRIQYLDCRDGLNERNLQQLTHALDRLLPGNGETHPPDVFPPAVEAFVHSNEESPLSTPALSSTSQSWDDDFNSDQESRYRIATLALSDKPTENDLLGFMTYAEALAGFILHPKTDKPLTIAINAVWGSGKSSLMYMIRRELHRQVMVASAVARRDFLKRRSLGWLNRILDMWGRIRELTGSRISSLWNKNPKNHQPKSPLPAVWFNAWKYDNEEAIWAALALCVINQVAEQSSILRRFWIKLRLRGFNFRQLLLDILKSLLSLVVLAGIGILGVLIISLIQGRPLETAFRDILVSILLGGVVAAVQLGRSIVESSKNLLNLQIDKYIQAQPNYQEKIGFLAEFENDFKRLVNVVTQQGKYPLVIFIDDIDRCDVPKAADLIEAINIFLNTDHCVFIIGMDMTTVAASIEVRYEKLREFLNPTGKLVLGQQFLEKIVQIVFPIPQPDSTAMKRFIEGNLSREEGIARVFPESLETLATAKEHLRDQIRSVNSIEQINSTAEKIELDVNDAVAEILKREVIGETILENFDNLDEVKTILVRMLDFLDYNPRRIKRFINVFRLQAFIAVRLGSLVDRRQLISLGTWLEIAFRWPQFIEHMMNSTRFDDDLYSAYKLKNDILNVKEGPARDQFREDLKEYLAQPGIKDFIDETALIELLPKTTSFGDDEVIPILLPALQIVNSTPIVKKPA